MCNQKFSLGVNNKACYLSIAVGKEGSSQRALAIAALLRFSTVAECKGSGSSVVQRCDDTRLLCGSPAVDQNSSCSSSLSPPLPPPPPSSLSLCSDILFVVKFQEIFDLFNQLLFCYFLHFTCYQGNVVCSEKETN